MIFKFSFGKEKFADLINNKEYSKNTIIENDDFAFDCVRQILVILDNRDSDNEFTNNRILFTAFETIVSNGLLELGKKLLPLIDPKNVNGYGLANGLAHLALAYMNKADYKEALEYAKKVEFKNLQDIIYERIEDHPNLLIRIKNRKEAKPEIAEKSPTSYLIESDHQLLKSNPPVQEVIAYFDAQKSDSKKKPEINEYDFYKRKRILEIIDLYLQQKQFDAADALVQLIIDKNEKWKVMRKISLEIAKGDINKGISYAKKIKENYNRAGAYALIGLQAYDNGNTEQGIAIINDLSENLRETKQVFTNQLIEKLIRDNKLQTAWELAAGMKPKHDNYKYDAVLKLAFKNMVEKEPLDMDKYLNILDFPETKILFWGALAFFNGFLKGNYTAASWWHFAPNSQSYKNLKYYEIEDKIRELYFLN